MKIIRTIPEDLTKKQLYMLTKSPRLGRMKDAVGSVLEVEAVCQYEDVDGNGEIREILSISTHEGESFATNSKTFQNEFWDMVEMFGEVPSAVEVISGTSKAGRPFITCAYAGE